MASKQRARAPKAKRQSNPLDLGILIPDLDISGIVEDDDDDDEEEEDESALEAELSALLSGKGGSKPAVPKKKAVTAIDIEKSVADCLKDVSDDDDENLDDPDLLEELKALSCTEIDDSKEALADTVTEKEKEKPDSVLSLLNERLALYNQALSAAKANGDNTKARRYDRGVKNLENLIKCAKSGKAVNADDIPPMVTVGKRPPQEPPLNETPSNEAEKNPASKIISFETTEGKVEEDLSSLLAVLKMRREKYKNVCLNLKRAGDKASALEYMKNLKILDAIIKKAMESKNEKIDLSNVPPSPPMSPVPNKIIHPPDTSKKEEGEMQTSIEAAALSAASEPEDPSLFAAPPPPSSVLEALNQRLERYKTTKLAAVNEGNASKARRLERIVKSYEKAIKDFKAGKEVDFEELPAPPGFAPIPVPDKSKASAVPSKIEKPGTINPEEATISVPKKPAPVIPPKSVQPKKPKVQRTNTTSLVDKQLEFLLERQRLFREAAIASKKAGDIAEAKEFLRMSKGFDSMIEATRSGLPVDFSQIPTPPQLADADFVVVDRSECTEGSDYELFEILITDLTKQIEICKTNKEHFFKVGDVASASKFEKLGLELEKDLKIVYHMQKTGQLPPKFHYETRMFSVAKCNPDIADNELEVTVERGINLPGKADKLDSFVKIEFAVGDTPQKAKTNVIWDTNNPVFKETFKFNINRKSRSMLRLFKRQALKLEVFSKGGFLRSDALIGTVAIKLVDLESNCLIHDSFDIMDSRKSTGGKLEVKIRIRQPLLVKEVQQVQEKWLVIGS